MSFVNVPMTSKIRRFAQTAATAALIGLPFNAISAFADEISHATAAQLTQTQFDIGNTIKPLNGEVAGDALGLLLQQHIGAAVAVVNAAKAGDTTATEPAIAAAFANAREIGDFLASANSNRPQTTERDMLKIHIDTTLIDAIARFEGRYEDGMKTVSPNTAKQKRT